MNTRNSHVHDHFRELANIICPVREPSPKEYLKTEIKTKILALSPVKKNMYVIGIQAAIQNEYDFDSVIYMVRDYVKQAPKDITACLGQDLIDLITKYPL